MAKGVVTSAATLLRVGLLSLALAACGTGNAKSGDRQRPAPLVAVERVAQRDVEVTVRAPVDLRPLAQADVTSKAVGYLDAVLVDRGDTVKRGQLLALVRPSDLPDQLSTARSGLAEATAAKALAKTNYERAQKLAPAGLISEQQLQAAAAALATAEAGEASARSQIGGLATKLGETRIESPLDGVITARALDPGALVGPGTAGSIVHVARVDVLRVFMALNEREASGIAVGKLARVEFDALPGRSFEGKVVRVAPAFDPTTRTLEAEVHLDNAAGELRPGMYGRALLVVEIRPARPVVPVAAVRISPQGRSVFVVNGDRVARRPVELGFDGETWFEVVRGLRPGEEIVTAGLEGLSDGATVRRPGAKPPASGSGGQAPPAPAGSGQR